MTDDKADRLAKWFHYDRVGGTKKAKESCALHQEDLNRELVNANARLLASLFNVPKVNAAILFLGGLVREEEWEAIRTNMVCHGILMEDDEGRFGLSADSRELIRNMLSSDLIREQTKNVFNLFSEISAEAADVLRTQQTSLGSRFFFVEGQNLITIITKSLEFGWIDLSLRLSNQISYAIIQIGILDEYDQVLNSVYNTAKDIPPYSKDVASLLNNLGRIYQIRGELDKSLQNYEEALRRVKELGDYQSTTHLLARVAEIYVNLNKFDLARDYYQARLAIHQTVHTSIHERKRGGKLGDTFWGYAR